MLQVAKAVALIQEKRIVHRDLKPDNILLDRGIGGAGGGGGGGGGDAVEPLEDDPDVRCVVNDFGEMLDGRIALHDLVFNAHLQRKGAATYHSPEVRARRSSCGCNAAVHAAAAAARAAKVAAPTDDLAPDATVDFGKQVRVNVLHVACAVPVSCAVSLSLSSRTRGRWGWSCGR